MNYLILAYAVPAFAVFYVEAVSCLDEALVRRGFWPAFLYASLFGLLAAMIWPVWVVMKAWRQWA